jgi:hypothetical protein
MISNPAAALTKNRLCQPRLCVSIPPKKGAADNPTYTAVVFSPIILPRFSGKAEIMMASLSS